MDGERRDFDYRRDAITHCLSLYLSVGLPTYDAFHPAERTILLFVQPNMKQYCFALIIASSFSQAQGIKFEGISLEQGLSQTSVFSITQDRQGFLWFATQDGLNRYDGYSFSVYRHNPRDTASLSDNYVTTVCVDGDGTLWAGTRGGGLNRFIQETGQFARYAFSAGDPLSLSNNEIRCLYADRGGTLWIGTSNGLNRYEKASGRFLRFLHDPSDSKSLPAQLIHSLYEDSRGNFWIGLQHGVALIDRTKREFISIVPDGTVTDLVAFAEDNEGTLWIGTQEQLLLQKKGHWTSAVRELRAATPLTARRILRDSKGTMWFGSDAGLWSYSSARGALTRYLHETGNPQSLTGNSILSLFEDRNGILWIGTFDGINKYAAEKFKFEHVAWRSGEVQNAGWNKIRGFSEDQGGRIWVATQEGLMSFEKRTKSLRRFPTDSWYTQGVGTRLLWTLLEDGSARNPELWVGTNGQGLVRINFRSSGSSTYVKYMPISNDPRSLSGPSPNVLCKTRDGTVWVGTLWEGLNRFDRASGRFRRYTHDPSNPRSISSNEIWALSEDRHGNLWVGTAGGGLNMLDVTKGTFLRYSHDPQNSTSLSDNKVLAILEDETGDLWIGTYSGLNRLNPQTGVFKHYTLDDGLPNNVVYGILDDRSGNLWLSTNKGLSRFTIQTQKFRNYEANDGLQSNEFNHGAAFRSRSGEMYFGGVNGFNTFNAEKIRDNSNVPEVVFTEFRVFNKPLRPSPEEHRLSRPISQADVVTLSYKDAVISIEFAALEFTNPSKNQYSYKMEGFDEEWSRPGPKRDITYTNLDPGEYVFRIKASNNDEVWNEQGASLRITVLPPFWGTWWFRFMMAAAFLGSGPAFYFWRVSRLQKERAVQEKFAHRLLEEQERERQRIAGELHDSLGQDLLVVKNRASLGLRASTRVKKAREQFEEISQIVSRTLQDVRRLSHNLRPYQLDRLGLSDTLRSALQNVESSTKIRFKTHVDPVDKLLPPEAEINVFRIVQEAITNILKHAGAKEAEISVTHLNGSLAIRIRDNGKGFHLADPTTPGAHSFGLTGIHQRVRLLGGTCIVDSTPNRGTVITIAIPLQEDKA